MSVAEPNYKPTSASLFVQMVRVVVSIHIISVKRRGCVCTYMIITLVHEEMHLPQAPSGCLWNTLGHMEVHYGDAQWHRWTLSALAKFSMSHQSAFKKHQSIALLPTSSAHKKGRAKLTKCAQTVEVCQSWQPLSRW